MRVLWLGGVVLAVLLGLYALAGTSQALSLVALFLLGFIGLPLNPAMASRVMSLSNSGALINTMNTATICAGVTIGTWLAGVGIDVSGYRAPMRVGALLPLGTLATLLIARITDRHRAGSGRTAPAPAPRQLSAPARRPLPPRPTARRPFTSSLFASPFSRHCFCAIEPKRLDCPMGRPRKFDETRALTAVMNTFWQRGYEATSTRDLAESTGMGLSSLSNAFGGKRQLYLRALRRSYETNTVAQTELLGRPGPVRCSAQRVSRSHEAFGEGFLSGGGRCHQTPVTDLARLGIEERPRMRIIRVVPRERQPGAGPTAGLGHHRVQAHGAVDAQQPFPEQEDVQVLVLLFVADQQRGQRLSAPFPQPQGLVGQPATEHLRVVRFPVECGRVRRLGVHLAARPSLPQPPQSERQRKGEHLPVAHHELERRQVRGHLVGAVMQ
ncbi:TetR family transcriptional regulator [Streptomyces sp. NPDC006134]|uniref:TetR family transcriptional regulator n=1 Tax=Streptomyces sp. NPDC006134 TaxID=3154467 RepID=UPI0033D2F5DB